MIAVAAAIAVGVAISLSGCSAGTSDNAGTAPSSIAPAAGVGLVSGSQIGFGDAQASPPDTSQSIPSPNVYEMHKEEAKSELMNAGLMPVFIYLPSDRPKGTALTQVPLASEPVQMSGVVLVAMSTGVAPKTASIKIPDVAGKSQADAIKALGVSLGPISSATIATVPDVRGMDAVTAIQMLASAGFLTQQADINDTVTAPGKIADQVPSGGWKAPSGSVVIISVSTAVTK